MGIRKSVTFYDDQYKFWKSFNSPNLFLAFAEYMFENIEPKGLTEQEKVLFESLRTRMDNQKKKASAGASSHGGGRRPKTTKKTTEKQQKNNKKTTEGTTKKQEDKEISKDILRDISNDISKDKEEDKDKEIKKINKKKFLDFVFLSDDEHNKLIEKFGEKRTNEKIENLNNYIGSTGKKYKSHYFTILNWSKDDPGGNKDYEMEKKREFHDQKILKQFENFSSANNENESNGNQTGGYNRRNDIGFKELSG